MMSHHLDLSSDLSLVWDFRVGKICNLTSFKLKMFYFVSASRHFGKVSYGIKYIIIPSKYLSFLIG